MNISTLIKQLQDLKQEHGDIPIHIWADHGQMCLTAYDACVSLVDSDGEIIHPDDAEQYNTDELTRVIVIDG